jgi:hypothetical protein
LSQSRSRRSVRRGLDVLVSPWARVYGGRHDSAILLEGRSGREAATVAIHCFGRRCRRPCCADRGDHAGRWGHGERAAVLRG